MREPKYVSVQGERSNGMMDYAIKSIKRNPSKTIIALLRYDTRQNCYYGVIMAGGIVPIDYRVTRNPIGQCYRVTYYNGRRNILAGTISPAIKAADFAAAILETITYNLLYSNLMC